MIEFTNIKARAVAGLALLIYLSFAANYFFDLHWFGRYDKLVLALCTFVMVMLATALRRRMPMRRPSFSWSMFTGIAAAVLGVCAWVEWRDYVRSGSWNVGGLVFLPVPVTLLAFMGYRWRLLRKELLDSTFSDERYHADPSAYLMGSWRQLLPWMGVAISISVALAAILAFRAG